MLITDIRKIFLINFCTITIAIIFLANSQYNVETDLFLIWILVALSISYTFGKIQQKQKIHLESILESVSDSFFAVNRDMVCTYCNKGAINYFKVNPMGKSLWDIYSKRLSYRFEEIINQAKMQKQTIYDEYISPINNRWLAVSIYPATNNEGFSVFFRDIQEIKLTQEQLRQAKERFLKVFNLNPNIMILTTMNDEAIIVDANEAYLKTTGLRKSEIIGCSINECTLTVDVEKFNKIKKFILENGFISNCEIKFRCKDEIRNGILSSEILEIDEELCVLSVITDITEKEQLNKELARYDSLNLVGEIAASIGHEVRNPMTTVRGYLQMFQNKPEFNAHKEQFATMIEELDRANAIITEFLTLAKNKSTEMRLGNLNNIVNVLFPLVQADAFRLGHSVQIESQLIEDNLLNEKEIRQLILNLVRNAFEAMENSGVVKIRTYSKDTNNILEISDTGKGIPGEILDKIGTPFMTTKQNGTGLGLSVCYRIAQRHNAKIDLKTDCTGTTFYIQFPK